ncbi:MAG: ATP-grasp domain-containing protein [Jatrophihabitantaceae bacterium]
MSTVILVEPTAPGLRAIEAVNNAGHRSVVVRSPIHDYLLTDEQHARRRELADLVITLDDLHDLPAVLTALTDHGVDLDEVVGAFTTVHLCVLAAAQLAKHLGLPGTAPDILAAAKDKAVCRTLLDQAGVPNLQHGVAAGLSEALEVAARIGYPVAVKPVHGTGKAHAGIAHDEWQVRALFESDQTAAANAQPALFDQMDGRFVVEELAVGPLYSVEVACDGQSWTPLVAIRRKLGRDNPIVELGSTVPCGLSAEDEEILNDYAVQACRAARLSTGVYHVEVIGTADGPRLVEINPRIAGGAIPDLVETATGVNLFDVLADVSTSKPAPASPLPHLAGVSHTFITAAEDCVVRADLPDDWFEQYRPRIHSGWSSIRAGSQLRRMNGNYDVYGVVRVVAGDAHAAEADCARLVGELEQQLGVPLTPIAGLEQLA